MRIILFFLSIGIIVSSCGYNHLRYVNAEAEGKARVINVKKNSSPIDFEKTEVHNNEIKIVKDIEYAENIEASLLTEPSAEFSVIKSLSSKIRPKNFNSAKHFETSLETESGFYVTEAESKFRTAIILLALGIVTLGFTYLIGLGVFISACIDYSKVKTKTRSLKVKFGWALGLFIVDTLFIALVIFAMFYFNSLSIGSI